MTAFLDLKSARAVVAYETTRNKVVYAKYIAANEVTLDNVSAHVLALQGLAFPDFDKATATDEEKYARKSFGNRVRNGLNTHLGKVVPSKREETTDASAADAEETAPEAAPAPAVASTGDLISAAEDLIRTLTVRAIAGDVDAAHGLASLRAAAAEAATPVQVAA